MSIRTIVSCSTSYCRAYAVACLAALGASAVMATPILAVGGGPDQPDPTGTNTESHGGLHTDPAFDPAVGTSGGWIVGFLNGQPQRPVITADPAAPNWIKVLQLPQTPRIAFGTFLDLNEFLEVGPGPAWTDWHERITTPGWEWRSVGAFFTGAGQNAAGTASDSNADGLLDTLDFEFDPLQPGNVAAIQKQLRCAIPGGCSGEAVAGHGFGIVVREFPTIPTIPEPGTLLLLAIGMVALAASKVRGPSMRGNLLGPQRDARGRGQILC